RTWLWLSVAACVATIPVIAPLIDRVIVYVPHFMYGRLKAPSIEAAPTNIATSGPKSRAAKRTRRLEIELSIATPRISWTLARSAITAVAASTTATQIGSTVQPTAAKLTAHASAATGSEMT